MTATVSAEQATMIQRHAAFFKKGTAHPLKAFQKIIPGLMAAASPVLQLGLLRMRPIKFWLKQRVPSTAWRHRITVTRACISALARWRDLLWLKQGVILDTAHRRKVVTTDASNKGWGAVRRQTDLRSLVRGRVGSTQKYSDISSISVFLHRSSSRSVTFGCIKSPNYIGLQYTFDYFCIIIS